MGAGPSAEEDSPCLDHPLLDSSAAHLDHWLSFKSTTPRPGGREREAKPEEFRKATPHGARFSLPLTHPVHGSRTPTPAAKKKKKKPRKSVGRCLIPYPDAVGAHRFLSRKKPLHQFRRLFGLDLTSQHFTNLRHKVVSYSIFIERGIGIDFTCRQAMFLLYDL